MGQRGCSLTAPVDTKEHWMPEWKIRMILTGLRDLLGIKDLPRTMQMQGYLQQGYQALQEPLLLLMGLQKTDRELGGMSRAE